MAYHNFYANLLGIKTEYYDPNPKYSSLENSYRQNVNDCFVRALSKLLNKSWDEVFKDVAEIAFENKMMYNSVKCNEIYLDKFGFKYQEPIYRSISVGEFMYNHKSGEYLIGNYGSMRSTHIIAYINGTVYDIKKSIDRIDLFLTDHCAYVFTKDDIDDPRFQKHI